MDNTVVSPRCSNVGSKYISLVRITLPSEVRKVMFRRALPSLIRLKGVFQYVRYAGSSSVTSEGTPPRLDTAMRSTEFSRTVVRLLSRAEGRVSE